VWARGAAPAPRAGRPRRWGGGGVWGGRPARDILGWPAPASTRLPALLEAVHRVASGPGLAWAVCAATEWLVRRPGEVQAPREVLAAVAAVRAHCLEPDRSELAERLVALAGDAADRLQAAYETFDSLLLLGPGLFDADRFEDDDHGDSADDDQDLPDVLPPRQERARPEAIRFAEQACRDIELEQLVLEVGLRPAAEAEPVSVLEARVRGEVSRYQPDLDDDVLDEQAWEADLREREAAEHVRASLEAWLLR
jgi:hypothetical protein